MIKMLINFLLAGLFQATSPTQSLMFLKQFMQEVVDEKLDEPALAEKYMCPSLMYRADKNDEKARMLFHMTLASYREELRKRQIDPRKIVITRYDELASKPLEIMGDTQLAYVAQYNGEVICYFLLKNEKIASFTVMDKGKRGFFISYCE